ncbi:hypothetical protein [Paenibacillus qinlingensis]|uniref:Uncharacterized protein n=1 Tax=Paenibacillus qinlingensis TaxID=1837343 RepID=A0ABU1P1Z1_9BACL|nr:hypothetical protein [Paenibacillus qinlingensis]MDR6553764.1 hypothetical protein [Paenibacillus qinlingensis]
MSCYQVTINEDSNQTNDAKSYIGGVPTLPNDISIPCCKLCSAEMTFFLQIAFPTQHKWNGYTLALFCCTSCVDEKYFIPEMLTGRISKAIIPEGFLDEYQRNFSVIVFDTSEGIIKDCYVPKVKYKHLDLLSSIEPKEIKFKVGGTPRWYLGDETPSRYGDSSEMNFLMQIPGDFEFEILPDAPKQVKLGLGKKVTTLNRPFYRLFLANNIYFLELARICQKYISLLKYKITVWGQLLEDLKVDLQHFNVEGILLW